MQNPIALMDKEKAIISDGLYLWLPLQTKDAVQIQSLFI